MYNLMNHIAHKIRPRGTYVYAKPRQFIPTYLGYQMRPWLKWYPKNAGIVNYAPAAGIFTQWLFWPVLGEEKRKFCQTLGGILSSNK